MHLWDYFQQFLHNHAIFLRSKALITCSFSQIKITLKVEIMFCPLTAKIILVFTVFFSFLLSTIVQLLHSGFIPVVISNTFSVISIDKSIKPSKVMIYCRMYYTVYFADFSLDSTWRFTNISVNFEL